MRDIVELLRPHVRRIFEEGRRKGLAEAGGHDPLPAVEHLAPFDPDPDAELQEESDRVNHARVSPHLHHVLGAMLDHAIEAAEGGRWMGAGLDALCGLLDDPDELAFVGKGGYVPRYTKAELAGVEKGWMADVGGTGSGHVMSPVRKRQVGEKWESQNHPGMWFTVAQINGKLRTVRTKKPGDGDEGVDRAKRADAAHAELSQQRIDALAAVKAIRQKAAAGGITAEDLRALAGHMEHLSVPELYRTRELVGIQHRDAAGAFKGSRQGDAMRAAFAAYARDKAAGLDTPEDTRTDAERIEQDLDPTAREGLRPDRSPVPGSPPRGQGDDPEREQSLEEAATGSDVRFGSGRRAQHRDRFSPARDELGEPDTSRPGWNAPATRPAAGGTRVVGEDGRPLTVYHGSPNTPFGAFDDSRRGQTTKHPTSQWGHFFTPEKGEAERYATFGLPRGETGHVVAAELDLKNPYPMSNREFARYSATGMEREAAEFKKRLVEQGYDGIHIQRGTSTDYHGRPLNMDEYVAFHPGQIRSRSAPDPKPAKLPVGSASGESGVTYGDDNDANEPGGWSPEAHLKLAADTPKRLRKQDVGRLFDQAPEGKASELADYLVRVRPDLSAAVADALAGDDEVPVPGPKPKKGKVASVPEDDDAGDVEEGALKPAAHPIPMGASRAEREAILSGRLERGERLHHPDDGKPVAKPKAAPVEDEGDGELAPFDHAAELARRRDRLAKRLSAPVAELAAGAGIDPANVPADMAAALDADPAFRESVAAAVAPESEKDSPAPLVPAPKPAAVARRSGGELAPGAALPPNTVIMAVRDHAGNVLARLTAPHDGTERGIKDAAEELTARAHEEYPEFTNAGSKTGATDAAGEARHVVSPNRNHVADISTEEGRYIFGVLPKAPAKATKPAALPPHPTPDTALGGANEQLAKLGLAPSVGSAAPHVALADALAAKLRAGEPVTAKDLWREADAAFGGTRAEGKYGPSDAYDALEAGFNRALAGATDPTAGLTDAQRQARELADKVNALPTQTNRSGNKDAFQQFSTPPHYAFAAAWVANLKPGEHVLEPSAGTGSLATQVRNAGAEVHANELDPRRADFLRDQFDPGRVHGENAEQIAGILPARGVAPTAVVMNPPFSQTAGRLGNKKDLMTGANHIAEAMKVLAPGGRLVAIVGRGMAPDSPTYREWFAGIKDKYSVRANVGVSGDEYKKYGTAFGTRLLVIDKTGPHAGETVTGDAADVPDLMAKLEGVRDDRPVATERAPGLPAGGAAPGGPPGAGGPAGVSPAGSGAGVPGGVRGGLPVQPVLGGVGAGGGAADPAGTGVGGVADGAQPRGVGKRPRGKAGAGAGVAGAGGAPGSTAGGHGAGGDAGGGGKGARGKPVQRAGTDLPVLRPPEPVGVGSGAGEPDAHPTGVEKSHAELGDSLYESYRPALLRVPGAKAHPTPLVESAAMAAVTPPPPAYRPVLSPDLIGGGKKVTHRTKDGTVETQDVGLSEVQLESLVYAGQAHTKFLPGGGGTPLVDGLRVVTPSNETLRVTREAQSGAWGLEGTPHTFAYEDSLRRFMAEEGFRLQNGHPVLHDAPVRRGYFIGDGTGVGKGRQIAGVITDNWNQGRKKHVWVSQKQSLFEDAQRDWRGLGNDPRHVHHFDDIREAMAAGKTGPDEGIGFITYDTLKGAPKDKNKASNLEQLAKWLGPDFDGVIAFDEAHGMGNALNTEGGRGMKEASQKALAGVRLQQMFPKARVLYVSATGATEVSNLAYAERLGLWGRGTPFPTKQDFIEKMNEGGVAAMEAVAQSLKAMGGYTARSLSFDDGTPHGKVTYERLTHSLTPDQHAMYDAAADGWQHVLRHIDKALEATGGKDNPNAKSAALSQFWGAQQRFFNQVMTSMQTPSVIRAMEEDIEAGRAPVVQLVNTMEAALKRAKSRLDADDADAVEDMDVSPKEVLMQYLERSFPTTRYEKRVDADGNEVSVPVQAAVVDENNQPVLGADGKPVMRDVEDPDAVAMRDELLAMVGTLRIPESPLDMIVNHFGHEHVAECTGRGERVVHQEQADGTRRKVFETRGATANSTEARAFQDGRKKILIFSDAGGTGRSYHADKNAQNQKQRVHYMLQPGWRADNAVQGLGRTHRTNQAVAPTYRLVEIDQLKAQKRFISTIARRLDQLGALTKGQRQAGSAGLFKAADNLESPEAREALVHFFNDLHKNQIPGLDFHDVMAQLGFEEPKEKEGRRNRNKPAMGAGDVPPMGQFLNRLLSLRVELQGKVFDAYEDRLRRQVERAMVAGTLNAGVENFPADRLSKKADVSVHRDADTGAEARLFVATARRKANKRHWKTTQEGELPLSFVRNKQSGRVWAVYKANDTTDARTGNVIPTVRLKSPAGSDGYRPAHEVPEKSAYGGGYTYSDKYERLEPEAAEKLWDKEYAETPDHFDQDEHFVTGAFLPIWDRIPGEKPRIYRLRTEDGTTVVGRHVPKDHVPTLLRNLGVSLDGDRETHTPETTHAALAGGRAEAKLANGWYLKPVRVGGERRIEVRGIGPAHMREVEQDGVVRERVGYDTRFFVPVGPAGVEVLKRITAARPITEVNPLTT